MITILNTLLKEHTRVGQLIKDVQNKTLYSYSRELIQFYNINNNFIHANRNIAIKSLQKKISKRYNAYEIQEIIDQFINVPVMQTADSCQLLYDIETFLNNFIYQIGMRQKKCKYLISQQCSTVKMLMYHKPLIGPGFVHLEDGIYKVFDLSKKKMANSNVGSLKNTTFTFTPEKLFGESNRLPTILSELKGSTYKNAAEAFLYANNKIWENIDSDEKLRLIQVDETYSSEIIANMLEDASHPLSLLLFDEEVRAIFLREINAFITSPNCLFLRNSTDFFYVEQNEQLVAARLSLDKQFLIANNGRDQIKVSFTRKEVIARLRAGKLYPNLLIAYLGISIFPMITAVGGSSQYEYLVEIQQILNATLIKTKILDNETISILTGNNLSTMLSGLIESEKDKFHVIKALDRGVNISELENYFRHRKIQDLMGNLSYFEYFNILFERRRKLKRGASSCHKKMY